MTAMNFPAFLTLLVLGLISSFVIHTLVRYRMLSGGDGFLAQWAAGYFGAWLSAPVFGHWGMMTGSLYLAPAILGAFTGSFLAAAAYKAIPGTAWRRDLMSAPPAVATVVATPHVEMRKVS